uniref:Uncharacterized protein n=1 Tax=Arundo donax TaxID=35708 RepID=A0A0A8Y375_ARUDO
MRRSNSVPTPRMTHTSASPTSPAPRSSWDGGPRSPSTRAFPSWSATSASASSAIKTAPPPLETSKGRKEQKTTQEILVACFLAAWLLSLLTKLWPCSSSEMCY